METPCSYPSAQTLQAKGGLLLADGKVSFYRYAWGADCTFRQPVNAWLVSDGNVSPFLQDKGRVDSVKLLILPTGDHIYLVDGEPVGAAASAFFLVAVRYDEPRLFRFLDGSWKTDSVASTTEPELDGDLLDTAERVGTGTTMRYISGTWKIDPLGLMATKVDGGESPPVNLP